MPPLPPAIGLGGLDVGRADEPRGGPREEAGGRAEGRAAFGGRAAGPRAFGGPRDGIFPLAPVIAPNNPPLPGGPLPVGRAETAFIAGSAPLPRGRAGLGGRGAGLGVTPTFLTPGGPRGGPIEGRVNVGIVGSC